MDGKISMPCGTGKTLLNVQCGNCKWHEDFLGACCNGDSEYRADFTGSDFVCDKWEERENA